MVANASTAAAERRATFGAAIAARPAATAAIAAALPSVPAGYSPHCLRAIGWELELHSLASSLAFY